MRIVVLVTLAVVLAMVPVACSDGIIGGPQPTSETISRIVGGSFYDGLPAVGAMLYNGGQHCSGTLVGPRKVVTAGHCVDGYSASRMSFLIGPKVSSPQTIIKVAAAAAHPDYDPYYIENDIAYLTLQEDAPVEPMGVVTQMDSSWVGRTLFFVGYGVDNGYNQTGGGTKRAVYMNISAVDAGTFTYNDANKNTCNGDSGGPAFYKDAAGKQFVAGVTSYGDVYCTEYGVDTRVDPYLEFLGLDQPEPDPCQGETAAGRCEGNTLVWCENSKVNRKDCAASNQECKYDAAAERYACVDKEPVDPCNGETFEGRCEGSTLIWCENDQVNRKNCATSGQECKFDEASRRYACVDAEPVDPCNGETYEGRCDGGTVIWCENEEIYSQDCAAEGKACVFDTQKNYFACRVPVNPDPCNGETLDGRCDGNTLIWCQDKKIQTQDCAADGQECALDSATGKSACVTVEPVDPCNGETWEGRCENGSVIWCEDNQVKSLNCKAVGERCRYVFWKGYYDCTW